MADLETDGLDPSEIHMVGVLDLITDTFEDYHGDDVAAGLMRLQAAPVVIGHNFRDFDAPVAARLTGGLIYIPPRQIVDTLDLSRELFPELPNHKLATWGELLGLPKLRHSDWSRWSPEMSLYCEIDCRIVALAFRFMLAYAAEAL